jgi:transcriptional regulator with XRE-family HTH domain
MTSEVVDISGTNERISRVIDALAAARGVHTRKDLAALVGIDEDTLGRRMNGKGKQGWRGAELLAIAAVLDVPISVLFESDPDDWFRASPEIARTEILRPRVRSVRDTPSYVSDYARLNRTALPGARVGAIDSAAA